MHQRLLFKYAKALNNVIPIQNIQVFNHEIMLVVEAKKIKSI